MLSTMFSKTFRVMTVMGVGMILSSQISFAGKLTLNDRIQDDRSKLDFINEVVRRSSEERQVLHDKLQGVDSLAIGKVLDERGEDAVISYVFLAGDQVKTNIQITFGQHDSFGRPQTATLQTDVNISTGEFQGSQASYDVLPVEILHAIQLLLNVEKYEWDIYNRMVQVLIGRLNTVEIDIGEGSETVVLSSARRDSQYVSRYKIARRTGSADYTADCSFRKTDQPIGILH